ncbi:hypothetical protein PsorP6_013733 [Peronosclerospora sorghi]|uniref:Uncharacterized protein n=1 Tax=Peronosclerospora sorghi TaxID=230839 RepID=A0ACC0VH89_9STRA|nr:hypothetical protein PsorP6_013733 [Peronosclerospora sorghi]
MGLLTDLMYELFGDDIWSRRLSNRWIPVLYTWQEGLSIEHYECHFRILMTQTFEHLGDNEKAADDAVSHVVDFSDAQRNAFCNVYAACKVKRKDYVTDTARASEYQAYREHAARLSYKVSGNTIGNR